MEAKMEIKFNRKNESTVERFIYKYRLTGFNIGPISIKKSPNMSIKKILDRPVYSCWDKGGIKNTHHPYRANNINPRSHDLRGNAAWTLPRPVYSSFIILTLQIISLDMH
jgi:hypothetical protein